MPLALLCCSEKAAARSTSAWSSKGYQASRISHRLPFDLAITGTIYNAASIALRTFVYGSLRIAGDSRWQDVMMPSKGAGGVSLFVSRLALIQSAVVVLHLTQYASHVTAHYLSSWDRRVTFGWDKYTAGVELLFCKLGSGNSGVVLPTSDSDSSAV